MRHLYNARKSKRLKLPGSELDWRDADAAHDEQVKEAAASGHPYERAARDVENGQNAYAERDDEDEEACEA
jgi:hypothetical protein